MSTRKSSKRNGGAVRGASVAFAMLLAAGCAGEDGRQGVQGPSGTDGEQGPAGPSGELDPNLSTWEKALAGIGSEDALESLTTFSFTASGVSRVVGEGPHPGDGAQGGGNFDVTVSYDLANDRFRLDYARSLLFIPGVELTYSELYDQQYGYVVGTDSIFGPAASTKDMPSPRWAAGRKVQRLINPHLLLKEVLAAPSLASDGGYGLHNGSIHELLVVDDAVHPITLWINAATGRIAKLTTMASEHLHRDSSIEVHFVDWKNHDGGVAFPNDVFVIADGEILLEEHRGEVSINPTLSADLFEFPAEANPMYEAADALWGETNFLFHMQFDGIGIPLDQRQVFVQGTELSPGVWFVGGSSHNSIVVEQDSGLVVIEPPLYPERSQAILTWIAGEPSFDGKQVTYVVLSHHHSDHAAGMREFVAAGATPVVSDHAYDYIEEILYAPSTVSPDTLYLDPVEFDIIGVPDGLLYTLDDVTNPVDVYHAPNVHAEDMVFIHLPNGGYLFESDLWNPGNGGSSLARPFAEALANGIDDLGITVNTIVGGHGAWGPLSELDAYLNQ